MIRIVFSEEEWIEYKKFFHCPARCHTPPQPPAYPILVESTEKRDPSHTEVERVEHSFIEVDDLRRMLAS